MKKLILSLFILGISTSSVFAQHDIKINAFGLLYKDIGLGYEYIINENLSAGFFANTVINSGFSGIQQILSSTDFTYSATKISPEFRYYFAPDFGADHRYISVYCRYKTEIYSNLWYDSDNNNNNDESAFYDFNNVSYSIGINTGNKWIFDSGIYIETLFGFGKNIASTQTFSNENAEVDIISNGIENYEPYNSWEFRYQLSVGYRIGGY